MKTADVIRELKERQQQEPQQQYLHDNTSEEWACESFWKFVNGPDFQDDLLFFVSSDESDIQVCRFIKNHPPSLNIVVNWSITLMLNLVCQMNFTLRICSCSYAEITRGHSNLVIDQETIKKVYANPVEAHVDIFYHQDTDHTELPAPNISFPDIYFSVQDFETCFEDMKLKSDSVLIVELICFIDTTETTGTDTMTPTKISKSKQSKGEYFERSSAGISLFSGAINTDPLSKIYFESASKSLESDHDNRGVFIMMNGPDGFGEAQIHASEPILLEKPISFSTGLKRIGNFLKTAFETSLSSSQNDGGDLVVNSSEDGFICRVTFIRMHWKELIKQILKN